MRFRVTFDCRPIGAIGLSSCHDWVVEAVDRKEAEEKARDEACKTHWHNHLIQIKPEPETK